jgi:hypothetical protein
MNAESPNKLGAVTKLRPPVEELVALGSPVAIPLNAINFQLALIIDGEEKFDSCDNTLFMYCTQKCSFLS